MTRPTFGSLFSGIGGSDLGLERAGWRAIWQSEIDPYACKVLAKHWPAVPNLGDVTKIEWSDVERPELIAGGYPCQPFSFAGRRAGTDDPRHLWPYFADALRVLRPRWALLENVPGHLGLGFDEVLADLASLGFDAEWELLPAAAFGAPHLRFRLFVVAYAHEHQHEGDTSADGRTPATNVLAHASSARRREDTGSTHGDEGTDARRCGQDDHVIDSHGEGDRARPMGHAQRSSPDVFTAASRPRPAACESGGWAVEPDVGRVADGVPARMDRLRGLGNAVVPQVAEWIGRRILEAA